MKPNTVHHIHIDGRARNAAQKLHDLERDTLRMSLRDYARAGQVVPDEVRKRALVLGVEVEA